MRDPEWVMTSAARVLLWVGCVSGVGMAQQGDARGPRQDLEPIASARTYHTPAYQSKLREILLPAVPWDSPVVFLSLPSFELETLVSVHPVGEAHEVVAVLPERQIWVDIAEKRDARIAVTTTKKVMPAKFAGRLQEQWRTMLARTCYTDDPPEVLDGVGYIFLQYRRGAGHRGGEVCNPAAGTRAAALAAVGEALVAYVRAKPADDAAGLIKLGQAMDALDALLAAVAKPLVPAGK